MYQEVDERGVRKRDNELIDGPSASALEDVDANEVAADRANPAGHRAKSARPVGQPDPHHHVVHASQGRERVCRAGYRKSNVRLPLGGAAPGGARSTAQVGRDRPPLGCGRLGV
jgi:hypothetical protein